MVISGVLPDGGPHRGRGQRGAWVDRDIGALLVVTIPASVILIVRKRVLRRWADRRDELEHRTTSTCSTRCRCSSFWCSSPLTAAILRSPIPCRRGGCSGHDAAIGNLYSTGDRGAGSICNVASVEEVFSWRQPVAGAGAHRRARRRRLGRNLYRWPNGRAPRICRSPISGTRRPESFAVDVADRLR